jgi:hypothetical protein
MPIWPRPQHQQGELTARIEFFVFSDQPIAAAEVDLAAEGWAAEGLPAGLSLGTIDPRSAPEAQAEWLAAATSGLSREAAQEILAAPYLHILRGELPDPPDLSHLQATWALARWLCRNGGFAVYDARAWHWHGGPELLAADPAEPLRAAGWRLVSTDAPLEGDPQRRHLVHTVGMSKFARPELLCLVPFPLLGEARDLLVDLGQGQCLGRLLPSPEQLQHQGRRFHTAGFAPGFNGPPLELPFEDQPLLITLA